MNAPQAKAELTTEPDPPRKGSNTFRVKITDANGAPISGAEVSVTFSTPAMPAMGMAAERAAAALADKGNGVFEGPAQLPSGGTYQVTVTVQRGGQTLATKQFSVTVAGGM